MTTPYVATYRLQLNHQFPLARARAAVPYLHRLGVSHVYCSPVLAARKGSMHGYDVVDPTRLNPELGTEDDWRALSRETHERGMRLILDIVPNHMATGDQNPYWDDVLRNGRSSRYASWFDVDWRARGNRIVLPVLGAPLDELLERGELRIEKQGDEPRLVYHEASFPLADPSLTDVAEAVYAQHYRLVFWRRAPAELNYRRFFDVNDLVALRAHDPEVFEQTHATVLRWVSEELVDGLRIDHVDGLLDPAAYLRRLRERVGDRCDIWVEKILLGDEALRDWPVQGTTGYESIAEIEDVLIDAEGFAHIEAMYRKLRAAGPDVSFEQTVLEAKELVLRGALRPDFTRVATHLAHAARQLTSDRPFARRALDAALGGVIACLPVYRTYVPAAGPYPEEDEAILLAALDRAEALGLGRDRELSMLRFALRRGTSLTDPQRRFLLALQQLTGPAAAKGVEDTALYRWVPLASRNEVGGDPGRPLADAMARMHRRNVQRLERFPLSLRTASTHDTKRSADARARIHLLSQIASEWTELARRWRDRHEPLRGDVPGLHRRTAPDASAEYLLYQTLVALWPEDGGIDADAIASRATEYMLKASREAKERTSWTGGDDAFEEGIVGFIDALLRDTAGERFREEMSALVARIAPHARHLALARELLRLTAPGVPDIYQGDEGWCVTLVDPDNRRLVKFDQERLETSSDQKLRLIRRVLALRRETWSTFRDGGYIPLEVSGDRAVGFVRTDPSGARHILAAALRLTLSNGVPPADAAVALPAQVSRRWRCALSGRLVQTRGNDDRDSGSLMLADLFTDQPVALLIAEPGV